jgi:hypothetical protein
MSTMIGTRHECQCCGRVARVIGEYDDGYDFVFEGEPGLRWISTQDALIRFKCVGDDARTVRGKLEESQ